MLSRRTFLVGAAGALLVPWRSAVAAALPAATLSNLESSTFVYISPLQSDGSESRCHGEVWFGWLDGKAVITTSAKTWKARAMTGGLDRARIWVGDYGRWKRLGVAGDAFRKGPHFDARAAKIDDPAVLEGLMQTFRKKYPDEIGKWEPKMRKGFETGERILIGYTPI
jgi:hypothetical protein